MFQKFKEDTTYIQNLEDLLKERIKGKIVKHEVRPLTEFGQNFGSEMLRVEITVEENGRTSVVHAVAKMIPPTEIQMEVFNTQVSFKNEIGFYAEIVPTLQGFQRENGIFPVADYFPKLYGARISLNPTSEVVDIDAAIVMENLAINGYANLDRRIGFDLDSAKVILRELANFQATALALRKKKPEVFKSKVSPYLQEWVSPPGQQLNFDSVLSENPNTLAFCSRVKKLMSKKRFKKIRELWATITHNDFWVNNIMVKESNGVIESVKFVDFQIPDYASPLVDVIFFLFSSVHIPVLKYHFDKLLQYYYRIFVETLSSFKIDTKEYTYESFQEEVVHEGTYQTFHSLIMMFVIYGPKEIPKMPGKVPEWNPNGQVPARSSSKGIPNGGPPAPGDGGPIIDFKMPTVMKEKIWFVVEEAAKRNWL